MASVSKHWLDVYTWIDQVIDSCKSKEQRDACFNLIANFERLYKNKEDIVNLSWSLRSKFWK